MLGFLWHIIVGRFRSCHHKWAEVHHEGLTRCEDGARIGYIFIQRCEHCGAMKDFRAVV